MQAKTESSSRVAACCLLLLSVVCLSVAYSVSYAQTNSQGTPLEASPKSPFFGLPSKAGPHIERIRKMPPNTWLEIGPPRPDPVCGQAIGRAWGSKMPLAPDWRGAFLFGEGRHGGRTERGGKLHYNDDLYFYDINAHRWVCVYPGMEVGAYDLSINADGFEVDRQGHPRPVASMVHSYAMHTYDPDRQVYWHMWSPSGYWRKWFPERLKLINENIDRVNAIGSGMGKTNRSSPWGYDTKAGHWTRKKTSMQTPSIGHGAHLIYLPSVRKLFFLWKRGAYFFDPETNQWTSLKPSGPRPPRPIDAPSCYDVRRDRVYIAMGSYGRGTLVEGLENRLWAYDVQQNTWIDLKPGGTAKPHQVGHPQGTNDSLLHCNSEDDVVVFMARGKNQGLFVYSPDKNEWLLDKPVQLPKLWGKRRYHGFYDPVLNAHFLFVASDSRSDGSMFVYRYGGS